MRISERQFGAARILDFQGPLVGRDARTQARQVLIGGADAGTGGLVIVNLARVADVDCGGLLALGEAERVIRRAGGTLRVALPEEELRPQVAAAIRTLFDAFDSVEDAVADLRDTMTRRRAFGRVPASVVAWLHQWGRWWRRTGP